jgi:hypothetical protein
VKPQKMSRNERKRENDNHLDLLGHLPQNPKSQSTNDENKRSKQKPRRSHKTTHRILEKTPTLKKQFHLFIFPTFSGKGSLKSLPDNQFPFPSLSEQLKQLSTQKGDRRGLYRLLQKAMLQLINLGLTTKSPTKQLRVWLPFFWLKNSQKPMKEPT